MLRSTRLALKKWTTSGSIAHSAYTDSLNLAWRSKASHEQKVTRMRYEFDRIRLEHVADKYSYELLVYYVGVKCQQYKSAASCVQEASLLNIDVTNDMIKSLWQSAIISARNSDECTSFIDDCWSTLVTSGLDVTPTFAEQLLFCLHEQRASENTIISVFKAFLHLGIFDDCLGTAGIIAITTLCSTAGINWYLKWIKKNEIYASSRIVQLGLQAAGRAGDTSLIDHFFYDLLPKTGSGQQLSIHHYTWLFSAYAAASSLLGCFSVLNTVRRVSLPFPIHTCIRWINCIPPNDNDAIRLMTEVADYCRSKHGDEVNGRLNETIAYRSRMVLPTKWSFAKQDSS